MFDNYLAVGTLLKELLAIARVKKAILTCCKRLVHRMSKGLFDKFVGWICLRVFHKGPVLGPQLWPLV